jgi:hypothetical protein
MITDDRPRGFLTMALDESHSVSLAPKRRGVGGPWGRHHFSKSGDAESALRGRQARFAGSGIRKHALRNVRSSPQRMSRAAMQSMPEAIVAFGTRCGDAFEVFGV